AVGQDLGHGVLGQGRFLPLISRRQRPDIIHGMVIADVLESVGDALDKVIFPDDGRQGWNSVFSNDLRPFYRTYRAAAHPLKSRRPPFQGRTGLCAWMYQRK